MGSVPNNEVVGLCLNGEELPLEFKQLVGVEPIWISGPGVHDEILSY